MINKLLVGAALASLSFSTAAIGQGQAGRAIVSIYHAAPGQQEALIKWLAQQDRLAAEAGVPPAQLYVHTDGADWDYLIIQPVTTDAQDAAIEAAAKRLLPSIAICLSFIDGPASSMLQRRMTFSSTLGRNAVAIARTD